MTRKNVLLIAFAGFGHQLGVPMFEFNNITSKLQHINKIYIRDRNNLWFHKGLLHAGDNIDSIADFLRQYTTHPATQRIVMFGSCGEGYAALLFGELLQADEVHAFAPKTFINPIRRLVQNDIPVGNRIKIYYAFFFMVKESTLMSRKYSLPRQHGRMIFTFTIHPIIGQATYMHFE